MSSTSLQRSADFLKISDQFQLGVLTTESSHPVTAELSQTARSDTRAALQLLFKVDEDVLRKFREIVLSGRLAGIHETVLKAVRHGGKIFFTGCGSTGRLSIQLVSIWRDFWQQQAGKDSNKDFAQDMENRAFSVMAGGDFALIKAVEGFEDFTEFGKRQIGDLGVGAKDVVFAITEGGETSFVIGTAWQGVESGAKVYFVYNNPDDILCRHVKRSREVIEDSRFEKINLTTGPMAITGSTRMQATSIQLCVLLTVMEMVIRDLEGRGVAGKALASASVPTEFLAHLETFFATLQSPETLAPLAALVEMEEEIYRGQRKNNYFAARFGIDVLTDTTERSPTYCTPPFRKFDDPTATESWAYLFVPPEKTPDAWRYIIKRQPRCVDWPPELVKNLVSEDKVERTNEIIRKISYTELMRFKVGMDGLAYRKPASGLGAVAIFSQPEKSEFLKADGFFSSQLQSAAKAGGKIGIVFTGNPESFPEIQSALARLSPDAIAVLLPASRTDFLLDGVTRVGLKMLLNTLSTCTMVRLGRVMGNYMIWVVPSNLKLIDRSTRYIQRLTQLDYKKANELLFEVIEYVEPRMKADQAYPPVVGVSVMRMRHQLDNQAAEERLKAEL